MTYLVENESLNHQKLLEHHEAIQIRVIERWLWSLGVIPSQQQLIDLLYWNPQKNGQHFSIQGKKGVQSRDGFWFLCGG